MLPEAEIGAKIVIDALPEIEGAAKALFADAMSGQGRDKLFSMLPDISKMGSGFLHAVDSHEEAHVLEGFAARAADKQNAWSFLQGADRTKAYKVLDIEGRSPGAPSVKWSLPKLGQDGQWQPGKWLDVSETPADAYPVGRFTPGGRIGLHVSNTPEQWSLGHARVRVFEAELQPHDRSVWQKLLHGKPLNSIEENRYGSIPPTLRDFPTGSLRLIRELDVK